MTIDTLDKIVQITPLLKPKPNVDTLNPKFLKTV